MDHEVLKVYSGITNVILRISSLKKVKTIETGAILLGAHIDSTIPSPGAAE